MAASSSTVLTFFFNVTISSEFQVRVGRCMTGTLSRVRIILFERKDARNNPSFANTGYELLTVSLNIFETINTGTILQDGENVHLLLKLIFVYSCKLTLF